MIEICPPCEPPEPPEYEGGDYGNFWGDPHFTGFDGGKYDVQGVHGETYNILSDQNIQFNATFSVWQNAGNLDAFENGQNYATVVTDVGIQVGDDQLRFDATQDGPILNGTALAKGQTVTVDADNEQHFAYLILEVKLHFWVFPASGTSFKSSVSIE